MESTEILRENVLAALEDRGATISWLAAEADISREKLSFFLHGHGGITIERAEKLANALEITLPRLLTRQKSRSCVPAA